jgi:hypothetical protein
VPIYKQRIPVLRLNTRRTLIMDRVLPKRYWWLAMLVKYNAYNSDAPTNWSHPEAHEQHAECEREEEVCSCVQAVPEIDKPLSQEKAVSIASSRKYSE